MSKGPRACSTEMCNRTPEKEETVWPQEQKPSQMLSMQLCTYSMTFWWGFYGDKQNVMSIKRNLSVLLLLGISKSFQSPPFDVCITSKSQPSCRIIMSSPWFSQFCYFLALKTRNVFDKTSKTEKKGQIAWGILMEIYLLNIYLSILVFVPRIEKKKW